MSTVLQIAPNDLVWKVQVGIRLWHEISDANHSEQLMQYYCEVTQIVIVLIKTTEFLFSGSLAKLMFIGYIGTKLCAIPVLKELIDVVSFHSVGMKGAANICIVLHHMFYKRFSKCT